MKDAFVSLENLEFIDPKIYKSKKKDKEKFCRKEIGLTKLLT